MDTVSITGIIGIGCPTDVLVDLSEPVLNIVKESEGEDKENSIPVRLPLDVTDSIEIERRESITLSDSLDIQNRILQDVTEKCTLSQLTESSVQLIDDEIFDFDLPVSPEACRWADHSLKAKGEDAEEEVFFGPVGFTEKCIAAGVAQDAVKPLSPLQPHQIAELAKEACSVAFRIANCRAESSSCSTPSPRPLSPAKRTKEERRVAGAASKRDGAPDSDKDAASGSDREGRSGLSSRQRTGTFTKESAVEGLSGKERQRQGTFTKEEPVDNLLSDKQQKEAKAAVAMGRGAPNRGSLPTSRMQQPRKEGGAAGAGEAGTLPVSKMQRPGSKLMRYNSGQLRATKMKPPAASAENKAIKVPAAPSQTSAGSRRSLQLPRAAYKADHCSRQGTSPTEERQRQGSGDSTASSTDGSQVEPACSKLAGSASSRLIRRTQSMNVKSGLPSLCKSRLAVPSQKTSAAASAQCVSRPSGPVDSQPVAPKAVATKPQLMQPSQLQRRSFATTRNKMAALPQNGPLKASAQIVPKMGDTVDRPYNPSLAAMAGGNSQCPSTPSVQCRTEPKTLSMSSCGSTPAKSSCSSSSVFSSTPGSTNRRSFLPTPSKRLSNASSLPSPSVRSKSSIGSLSKHSMASSSDACDSPVFDIKSANKLQRMRRTSGVKESCSSSDVDLPAASPFAFKSRKALVQNTPDLPKRHMSKWSPVRRTKPAQLEDQVSMCTKRVTPS